MNFINRPYLNYAILNPTMEKTYSSSSPIVSNSAELHVHQDECCELLSSADYLIYERNQTPIIGSNLLLSDCRQLERCWEAIVRRDYCSLTNVDRVEAG